MMLKNEMKILAVAVIYNPDIDLLKQNLDAFRNSVAETILWDNTPGGSGVEIDGLKVYATGKNMGLPYAYNFAYHYAKEHGFTHLMTMDQDSVWVGFDRYIQPIEEKVESAVYTVSTNQSRCSGIQEEFAFGMNSGNIIPIEILDATKGFNEIFFIDVVDAYFQYHAKELGYKVYLVGNCYLKQRFGMPTKKKIFGIVSVSSSNYSPMRLYGITRNYILLFKRFHIPLRTKRNLIKLYFIKTPLKIVLVENNKYLKLKALMLGVMDGTFGRESRINLFS